MIKDKKNQNDGMWEKREKIIINHLEACWNHATNGE